MTLTLATNKTALSGTVIWKCTKGDYTGYDDPDLVDPGWVPLICSFPLLPRICGAAPKKNDHGCRLKVKRENPNSGKRFISKGLRVSWRIPLLNLVLF